MNFDEQARPIPCFWGALMGGSKDSYGKWYIVLPPPVASLVAKLPVSAANDD